MYPVAFRIGQFEVTSFGLLLGVGALVGLWMLHRELRRGGLPTTAVDAGLAGLAGGFVGAKLLWVAEHVGEDRIAQLLFSRGGMSWFGGLAGGLLAGFWLLRRQRLPVMAVLAAATPALAVAHAIGRIGCFLVGDDYGTPSTLAWAVAFPEGLPPTTVPVHPTQLYEMAALLPIALLLLFWRRQGRSDSFVLGAYLTLAGLLRFLIEFIRTEERVALGLSVEHFASLAAAIVGLGLLLPHKGRRR